MHDAAAQLADVVRLPGCATEPVLQPPRCGRLPKVAMSLREHRRRQRLVATNAAVDVGRTADRAAGLMAEAEDLCRRALSIREGVPVGHRDGIRTLKLRRWFMRQAMEQDGRVLAISIALTAEGKIVTDGTGLEPVFVPMMINELRRVTATLVRFAAKHEPDQAQELGGNVVVLRQA